MGVPQEEMMRVPGKLRCVEIPTVLQHPRGHDPADELGRHHVHGGDRGGLAVAGGLVGGGIVVAPQTDRDAEDPAADRNLEAQLRIPGAPKLATTSDSKHQSVPDQHERQVDHITRHVWGGLRLRNAQEMVPK